MRRCPLPMPYGLSRTPRLNYDVAWDLVSTCHGDLALVILGRRNFLLPASSFLGGRFTTQSILSRQGGSLRRVIWRHHRIAFWQVPLGSVLFRRHAELRQMSPERFELTTIFQADYEVRRYRLPDGDSW